jgi:hypothetical protein
VIRRQELYDRDCVSGLIHVIEQVPPRAAVRRPLDIDRASVGLLLLWSILRWERTFVIRTLEALGVDLWSITRDVDEALDRHRHPGGQHEGGSIPGDLDLFILCWLDQAAEQARSLQHEYLSGEHLVLAMLADGSGELAAVLQQHGPNYDAFRLAVADAIGEKAASGVVEPGRDRGDQPQLKAATAGSSGDSAAENRETSSWIAEVDLPAVGVPRRFGVFILMMMVTQYAVLFSILRWLRATDLLFGLLAILFTGIGIGQAVLFGGRYPRAASIWVGSILVPIEVCVWVMYQWGDLLNHKSVVILVAELTAIFLCSIPLGTIFGYLFGTVTAASFYLLDWYENRRAAKRGESPID